MAPPARPPARTTPSTQDAIDGDEDGGRSEDEEMPDRTTEPGPSEQPPETGHPNEGSQTDDEFAVMDVEEEQPEDEASQPPRKRGRFENERSDSMWVRERGRANSTQRTGGRCRTGRSAHALQGTRGTKAPPHRGGCGKATSEGQAWTTSAQDVPCLLGPPPMNTPVREGETIEGSRAMRNRPYPVLKCSSAQETKGERRERGK